MSDNAKILIATEDAADADLVKRSLRGEFTNVVVSLDSEKFVEDFEKYQPAVLIFAFDTLEKAERCYLGLYRRSSIVHALAYRTLILCSKEDLQRVYDLCKKRYFDDYMLFWPMTHDTTRLPMAVHHALWALSNAESGAHIATRIVRQSQPLLDLDTQLEHYTAIGKERIEESARLLRQIQQEDSEALGPLRKWAAGWKEEFSAQLTAASKLREAVKEIRPVVLVVDDDEFQLKVLQKLLDDTGLESAVATSGTEALATMTKRRPDIVVMDVNLPDIDGIEVTRRLKRIEQFAGIPVIMITGQSEKNVVVESRKAGASDFVVKPFERDVLLAKITSLLSIGSSHEEPTPR